MARYALLIGIDRYLSKGITPLQAPQNDVKRLAEILKRYGEFSVEMSFNDDVQNIREKTISLTENKMREDVILFYYSGHGIRDFNGELYLTTSKTQAERPVHESVAASELRVWLSRCDAQSQIIILDCCYSGAFVEDGARGARRSLSNEVLARSSDFVRGAGADGYGSFVLMASDRDETVPAGAGSVGQGAQASHYTDLLIQGMEGAADESADSLSVQDVADYVEREGPRRFQIHPRSTRSGHGPLWLVRNINAGLNTLPDDLKQALVAPETLIRIGAVWRLGRIVRSKNNSDEHQRRSKGAMTLLRQRLEEDVETDFNVRAAIEDALREPQPVVVAYSVPRRGFLAIAATCLLIVAIGSVAFGGYQLMRVSELEKLPIADQLKAAQARVVEVEKQLKEAPSPAELESTRKQVTDLRSQLTAAAAATSQLGTQDRIAELQKTIEEQKSKLTNLQNTAVSVKPKAFQETPKEGNLNSYFTTPSEKFWWDDDECKDLLQFTRAAWDKDFGGQIVPGTWHVLVATLKSGASADEARELSMRFRNSFPTINFYPWLQGKINPLWTVLVAKGQTDYTIPLEYAKKCIVNSAYPIKEGGG